MSRAAWIAGAVAACVAAGAGFVAGHGDNPVAGPLAFARSWLTPVPGPAQGREAMPVKATGPVVYFRDPDGKPVYSASQMTTEDGREFRPVRASEDVSFDDAPVDEAMPGGAADASGTPMAHSLSSAMSPAVSPPSAQGEGRAVAGGTRPVLYYRNPMGLPDTSPAPKKDSMGMDYIPVYAGEDEDGSVVTVSPGRIQRSGVRTGLVERRVVAQPVRVPGTVALDERRVTVVATRSDAYIDHVENVTTGDRVRRGQPLVHIYSPDINAAAAQLIANPGFDGARRRLQNLNVSEEVIGEMERTRKVPMAITWSSPRDGVVLQRNAIEGMKAGAGETLFRIADVSTLWVLADVPERDLAAVHVGQTATLRLRGAPGRSFAGTVAVIYPQVNPETRATRVRIEMPNPDGLLLPDMYAEVEIATGDSRAVAAVPDEAILDTGERQIVLLDRGDGRFEPRTVTVGAQGGGYTAIRDGVAVGDRVVTAANFLIDAESNLKAALRSLSAPKDDRQAAGTGGVR